MRCISLNGPTVDSIKSFCMEDVLEISGCLSELSTNVAVNGYTVADSLRRGACATWG